MAEDDLLPFDPNMKKKKKKKKTGFDLDAAMGEDTGSAADGQPTPAPVTEQTEEAEVTETQTAPEKITDDFTIDFNMKKKRRKKKTALDLDDLGEALPTETNESEPAAPAPAETEFNVDDLEFTKKKKRKKLVKIDDDMENGAGEEDTPASGAGDANGSTAWISSDRDYTYDELLTRVFDIMREKNPDMIAGEKKKFVMRPPQVVRVGTRKTSFANFADICRLLHRQPKHVLAFLLAELGTSGSVDGNNQLIIRGKYTQKQIENVLRRYIKEYVTCHTCRSRDTLLQKETRLFFLQCESCGSRCSVASIKTGFQAVTSKRAAIRAKTA